MNNYTITEIRPKIFFVNFNNYYDMSMIFMRQQVFYEFPSRKFRGASFNFFEFMKYFSKKYGKGNFIYPTYWKGFNIPSTSIEKLYKMKISDENLYDIEFKKIYNYCKKKYPKENYYLISAVGTKYALDHEIAHGKYFLDKKYKKEMLNLINYLPKSFYNKVIKTLINGLRKKCLQR